MEDFKQRYIAARRAVIAQDLSRLNPMQRQAAMTTEGPLLLLAGAGSGKTTVLIQRVYNLLTYGRGSDSEEVPAWATEEDLQFLESFPARPTEEDVRRARRLCALDAPKPWEIIAITFTNKAAGELKDRLAARLGPDCLYVHTTREALDGDWILFREEHSHAAEHRLCADQLADWIDRSPAIVFVDDEFSTGRTLINMVQQLRERYPRLGERRLAAASILSRVSPENQARLAEAGIACECLVRLEHQDYERMVTGIPVKEAAPPAQGPLPDLRTLYTAEPLPDPRRGVAVGCYTDCCRAAAEELLSRLREELPDQGALLVLGTEECMYPALTVGSLAEQTGLCATVRCHATTRSPIGICPDSAYPIRNGVLLPSFYGGDRKTYLYDLAAYDAALVVTDAPAAVDGTACTRLAAALGQLGCPRLYLCRI